MTIIKLENIITYKTFGDVALADRMDVVINKLGEPDSYGNPNLYIDGQQAMIYGRFQFNFYNGILTRFQNKHIVNPSYKLSEDFHLRKKKFRVTSWLSDHQDNLNLSNFKGRIKKQGIKFIEEPYYDSIRLLLDNDIEIQFHSEMAYGKDPEEWGEIAKEDLNWKIGAIYVNERITT